MSTLDVEMHRERVAACKQMCAERFPLKGDPPGWLMQALAYHECVKLLHVAEAELRAAEKRNAATANGARP